MSRGSNAILWPFSALVNDVSGPRLSIAEPFREIGDDTRLSSCSSAPATRPAPLRRVKPPAAEAMRSGRVGVRDQKGMERGMAGYDQRLPIYMPVLFELSGLVRC